MERNELLNSVRRVVIKLGTPVLTTEDNRLDTSRIEELVEQFVWLRQKGVQLAIVTSGAIIAGMRSLGLRTKPKSLAKLQAAASVGQSQLMRVYERMFKERGLVVGQILLTKDVLIEKQRYLNVRNTFSSLFSSGVIPIINENDSVAVDEIKFGDNDTLSALVANLVEADLLIILSDVDGFYADYPSNGKLLFQIKEISPEIEKLARRTNSSKSIGGMTTKLMAAKTVTKKGKMMLIANGKRTGIIKEIFAGKKVGTIFLPK
ncbi:Glutamate 5-kinase [subsurface metagenome]